MKKKNIFTIIALILVDQIIKLVILKTIAQTGKSIEILNILNLTYVENKGAAFGFFDSTILLIGLDIMIIFVIIKLLLNKKYEFNNATKFGYSLILAGGIGNLIDRLSRGYVIDYIDISKIFEYPVFNFADMCIVVGVIFIIVFILVNTVKSQENANERV